MSTIPFGAAVCAFGVGAMIFSGSDIAFWTGTGFFLGVLCSEARR